jgi:K+:H+ antiporter subunit KhtU
VTGILAATSSETAAAFVEIGLVVVVLAGLARVASRFGLSAVPFYLIAGLVFGEGGLLQIRVSEEFISIAAEIGVLLLLLTLGLEYTTTELREGLRTGMGVGALDALVNFTPGLLAGLLLGWEVPAAALLGGVTWISSSGVISKVLSDLDRVGNRETPAILNLLVIEDLAMAVFLPVMAAIVIGEDALTTTATVTVALVAVAVVLLVALRWGDLLSRGLAGGTNEALLLAIFGLTLVIGGLAQFIDVSAAVGAFLVGLAVSGPAQQRATALVEPLRDLFASIFFLFFSFAIDPADLPGVLLAAFALTVVTGVGKLYTGWRAAARIGVAVPGRVRAGTALVARGEFSIVIAALGAPLTDGDELGTLAAAYVLLTAVLGPLAAKYADHLTPRRLVAR